MAGWLVGWLGGCMAVVDDAKYKRNDSNIFKHISCLVFLPIVCSYRYDGIHIQNTQ